MTDSIALSSAFYKFKLNEIAYSMDYRPEQQLAYVVSAKDAEGVIHAVANADLAIALNELFEVVGYKFKVVQW